MAISLRTETQLVDSDESLRAAGNAAYDDVPNRISLRGIANEESQTFHLSNWLAEHANVCNAITWETANGNVAYPDWSADRKADLERAFWTAYQGNSTGLSDPPPNRLNLSDSDWPMTKLSEDDAWSLYTAIVGHSLAVEIDNRVNWSITNYSDTALKWLFDGKTTFVYAHGRNGHVVHNLLRSLPAPPDRTAKFLQQNNLVANTRLETIGRVLDWCRDNLVHFFGRTTAGNMDDHWNYRGFPPVSRVIEGTVNDSTNSSEKRHWTGGCRATTGFLHEVLRLVNVPVELVQRGGHGMPHFVEEDRYLTHGDDPYNQNAKHVTPQYPATELLATPKTFDKWLGTHLSNQEQNDNVGRQVTKLAVEQYPPDRLVRLHCEDKQANRAPKDSKVLQEVESWGDYYNLSQLKHLNLWQRLDQKVQQFGGCDQVP